MSVETAIYLAGDRMACPECGKEAEYGECPGCEGASHFTHDEDTPHIKFPEPLMCEICGGDGYGFYCLEGDHFTTEDEARHLAAAYRAGLEAAAAVCDKRADELMNAAEKITWGNKINREKAMAVKEAGAAIRALAAGPVDTPETD